MSFLSVVRDVGLYDEIQFSSMFKLKSIRFETVSAQVPCFLKLKIVQTLLTKQMAFRSSLQPISRCPNVSTTPLRQLVFLAMVTFQLNNTKRYTLLVPHCRNGIYRYIEVTSSECFDWFLV